VNKAGELVLESINKEARVIWGSKINPSLEGKINATVVLAGVKSPFLLTERKSVTVTKNKPSKEKVSSKKKA
jgi:cell division GTPase FtsZ